MAKFKTGTTELEMLNDMVIRDMNDLYEKLHPKGIGDAARITFSNTRFIIIIQHIERHDLYEELGADVKKYKELIEKEFNEVTRSISIAQ